ncbi:MAG TPA: PD-(D/E)XK nuclease family protein [Myxococcota bacterium]|nr:PD-(D/E)XK nuclease family protein [Myxococcota bacterium]
MTTVFSHSRITTFEECPKRFEYRYRLKIPVESEGIEAFVGKRVHEVLERLYLAAQRGQLPALDRVLRRYEQLFDENFDPQRVRVVREQTPIHHYRKLGERCLSAYYRRHYPFDADETLGIEQRLTFTLDDARGYRFQGVIDRLARARDGAIEVHDYKTGRRAATQKQVDEDRQLALYQIGLAEQYPDRPIRLVWHYLQQDRTLTSTRTPEQLQALRENTISAVDRINSETEFEPRASALCDWCEYNDRCPIYPKQGARTPQPPSANPTATAQPSVPTPTPPRAASVSEAAIAGAREPGQLALFAAKSSGESP